MKLFTPPESRALEISCADIDNGAPFPVQFVLHPYHCLTERQQWEVEHAEQSMAALATRLFDAGEILGWRIVDCDIPAGAKLEGYPTIWSSKWSQLRARIQTVDRRFVPQTAHRDRARARITGAWL
jgi:hypothetical protein